MKTGSTGKKGGDCRFPRNERLKRREEIRNVFNRGRGVSSEGAKLIRLPNGLSHNRIAFTFSRKFGNAVLRNRSRRVCRELYRHLRAELRTGYDLVLLIYPEKSADPAFARPGKPGRDFLSDRVDQVRVLFSRAGLFNFSNGQE